VIAQEQRCRPHPDLHRRIRQSRHVQDSQGTYKTVKARIRQSRPARIRQSRPEMKRHDHAAQKALVFSPKRSAVDRTPIYRS